MSKAARIFVQMGPGGVGKTTVSAAFGMFWASQGKKVLVMTIDPSKRLAQALGVSNRAGIVKIPLKGASGELFVTLLNHGEIFDNFIRRMAKKNPLAEKLFENKLYQALKNQLQGSQDFTAILDLHEKANSGDYDIIILDTPPAQHAWQFLEAPEKLGQLFSEKITKWFQWIGREPESTKSIWTQILNVGTQKVLKALEFLTGPEFMTQIADFFRAIQSFQSQLQDKIAAAYEMMRGKTTEYTLVTTQDDIKIKESLAYAEEMRLRGFSLKRLILNRAWPQNQDVNLDSFKPETRTEIKRLLNLLALSQKTNEKLMQSWPEDVQILKVYDTLKSSHDLDRLQEMARDMAESFR